MSASSVIQDDGQSFQLMTIHDDTEVVGRGPTAVPEAVAFGIPGDSFKDGSCKYTVVEKKTLQMKVNLCFQDMPSSLETESVKGLMENVELPSSPDKSKSDRSDTVPEGYIATQASTERYGDLDTEIQMTMPGGYEVATDEVIQSDECVVLQRPIYGLVQSARQYWKKFVNKLKKEKNCEMCESDLCLL